MPYMECLGNQPTKGVASERRTGAPQKCWIDAPMDRRSQSLHFRCFRSPLALINYSCQTGPNQMISSTFASYMIFDYPRSSMFTACDPQRGTGFAYFGMLQMSSKGRQETKQIK